MMTPSGARHDAGLQEQPTINTSGPVRLAGAVEGALAGGWVGPRFQITVAADAPIEAIAVHGYLPYQRDGGVRFTITANGQVITRKVLFA